MIKGAMKRKRLQGEKRDQGEENIHKRLVNRRY